MCDKLGDKDYACREYEIVRYLFMNEEGPSEETIKKIETEQLADEGILRYAVATVEDSFGVNHLNGIFTPRIILKNFEKVNSEIGYELLNNLLFEYQDKSKNIPLMLTGTILGDTYLGCILANPLIKFKRIHEKRVTECLIQSQQKEIDYDLLTVFFLREDISIECKKEVIDFLDNDVLYILKKNWEDNFFNSIMFSLDYNELFCKNDEQMQDIDVVKKIKDNALEPVIELIDEKLYP